MTPLPVTPLPVSPRAPLAAPAHLRLGDVQIELRRSSRRRTVALRVGPAGAVLYAPTSVSAARLEQFLREREDWLRGHLAHYARSRQRGALTDGCTLPLLDDQLTLQFVPGLKAAWQGGDALQADPARLHAQLETWYRRQALDYFTALVPQLAGELSGHVKHMTPLSKVCLTNASGRWGSCTASGEVRLHWRLMCAPEAVARYVAAHEVAHLAQMNHSARYWSTLARLMPDHAAPKAWLRDHGESLNLWDEG